MRVGERDVALCLPPFVTISSSSTSADPTAKAKYDLALREAIAYGKALQRDYKDDARPEVRAISKKTLGIVAYNDPQSADSGLSGHEARVTLANELNKAILVSQGYPPNPPLETLYRRTAACVAQLGMLGEGAAAFADMQREFISDY